MMCQNQNNPARPQAHFLSWLEAQAGFTLVELMVVIAIIGIFTAMAIMDLTQANSKYTVESYTREIHSILMKARNDAANTKVQQLITLAANQVQVTQDTDGDGAVDAGEATTTNAYPRFAIQFAINPIVFDRRGMANAVGNQTIRITGYPANAQPGVDCIVVSATRINMGRGWNGGACVQR